MPKRKRARELTDAEMLRRLFPKEARQTAREEAKKARPTEKPKGKKP